MKKYVWILTTALIGLGIFTGTLWAQSFKEGKWVIIMITKMEGMEAEMAEMKAAMENMPPEQKEMMDKMMGTMDVSIGMNKEGMTTTMTQCLTSQNPVPEMIENPECDVKHTTKGNTVQFEIFCPEVTSTGEMTYTEDSMEGTMKSQQMRGGEKGNVTIKMKGQYQGPCRE